MSKGMPFMLKRMIEVSWKHIVCLINVICFRHVLIKVCIFVVVPVWRL